MSDEVGGIAVTIDVEVDRLERNLRSAGQRIINFGNDTDKATKRAGKAFESLEARMDPLAREARRLEVGQIKVAAALEKGVISSERAAAVLAKLNDRYERATMGTTALAGAQQRAGIMSRRMGHSVQQAGYQVGDFAVQMASGQDPLRAFIQQGTQLISMFGPWGAVIGAAGAVVGALATSFIDLRGESEEATDTVISGADAMKKALEGVNTVRRETLVLVEKLSGAYRGEAEQAARVLLENAQARLRAAQTEADARYTGSGAFDEFSGGFSSGEEERAKLKAAQEDVAAAEKRLAEIRGELDSRDAAQRELDTQEWLAKNTKKILEDNATFQENLARTAADRLRAANDARIREAERVAAALEKAAQPKSLRKTATAGQGSNSLTTGRAGPDSQRVFDRMTGQTEALRDRMAAGARRAEEAERALNQQVTVATGLLRQAQTPMDLYRQQLEAIAAAERAGKISAEQATTAREQATDAMRSADPVFRETIAGLQGVGRDLIRFGDDAGSFGERVSNAFERMSERVLASVFELQAVNPILNAIFGTKLETGGGGGGIFRGLFGGGGTVNAGGTPINPDGGVLSFLFHKGGIAGDGRGQPRSVPARAFESAPRLHGGGVAGLGRNEVPAILERGEEVITRRDMRHRFNMPRDPGRALKSGGGSSGGGGTYYIDARGADPGQMAQLRKDIQAINGSIEQRAVGAVVQTRRANPKLFG